MSNKFANIVGFLILGAIVFGFAGAGVAAAFTHADPSAVGKWVSFGGALIGAIFGDLRK